VGAGDFAGEKRAESRVVAKREFNFFEIDSVKFGISLIDGLPEDPRYLHFRNHLSLFGQSWFQPVLG
jgi:hypothetical protein